MDVASSGCVRYKVGREREVPLTVVIQGQSAWAPQIGPGSSGESRVRCMGIERAAYQRTTARKGPVSTYSSAWCAFNAPLSQWLYHIGVLLPVRRDNSGLGLES